MAHPPGTFDAELDSRDDVYKIFGRYAPLLVSATAVLYGACGFIFTWFQLFEISVAAAISNLKPDTLTRIALIIYYNAWVWGMAVEFYLSLKVYIAAPDRGRIPKDFYVIPPCLVLVGLLLFFVARDARYTSLALALFWMIDVYLWLRTRVEAAKWRERSAEIYRSKGSLIRLEQLRSYTDRYIRGNWHYYRFFVMALMLALILTVSNFPEYRSLIFSYFNLKFTDIPAEKLASFIPGLLIFLYILVSEIWSWSYRVRAVNQIRFLSELTKHYKFTPIENTA